MKTLKTQLADLLLNAKLVTSEQLNHALELQKTSGLSLEEQLLQEGFITENELLNILAEQLNLKVVDLDNYQINNKTFKSLPETYARRFQVLLLEDNPDYALVAMNNPLDLMAQDELRKILKKPIKIALVRKNDLLKVLDLVYRHSDDITLQAQALKEEMSEEIERAISIEEGATKIDAPVIKLLNTLFADAIQMKASDIHIEPAEKVIRIRLRIDGVLNEQIIEGTSIAPIIASRLKIISGLNMAEKRLPQDGRFQINMNGTILDIRLSFLPTPYGESMVMRLLNQSHQRLDFSTLGMETDILEQFRHIIHRPHGIVLVTGPTGSGKTTTLYAAINELNKAEKKIITVEDPIEYRMDRIIQVQVNEKIGLDFVRVLRTILRQDPNVILIGEMRDTETTTVAIRAALTGHLVLSTIHTNDSINSIMRLLDMGIPSYLVATSIQAILAQRLIRLVCTNCKTTYKPTTEESLWLEHIDNELPRSTVLSKGKGCNFCNHTGYFGRKGIYELLELNEPMKWAISKNDFASYAAEAKNKLKGKLLVSQALNLVAQGNTTISEAIRVSEV